ncbi:MAG: nucleoid-associated protein [Atopobiaceae bacterium]|nr:nucleoid-associated protein [Atopobiaceae bacterium]
MIRTNHAVLHAFDFETGSAYLSEDELPFVDDKQVKSYVQRHLRRISSSAESRHGEFVEGSLFAEQLSQYLANENTFLGLSVQVAQWFWEELRRADSVEQCDLLVAEFEDTGEMKVDGKTDDAGIDAAFEASGKRWFAVLVLPRKLSFAHEVGGSFNGIYRHDGMLPSPTQKVVSYLLVNEETLEIDFSDKPRLIAGREVNVIPDEFLKCTAKASSKDVFAAVAEIVDEVAEEAGLTPALEVSRAKAALAHAAERDEVVSPVEVGREVFAEREDLRERFEQEVREQRLPDEVPVKRGVANRMAKSHRIRTDTGIEITFPSDLVDRPGYIDFTREEDGRLTITISNVARIDNR